MAVRFTGIRQRACRYIGHGQLERVLGRRLPRNKIININVIRLQINLYLIMESNEFYRRLRYALCLDDHDTQQVFSAMASRRSGFDVPTQTEIRAWRCRSDEADYRHMPQAAMKALLDALVFHHRGDAPVPADTRNSPRATTPAMERCDNNAMLKGVRVALSLRIEDIVECIAAGGGQIGTAAVSAFFRKPGSRNYRTCGDQALRQFLQGLARRQRGSRQ